ncbi:Ubiquitin carboxyl-terminal hydrolase 42 [Elasticomyces elasticus]|nr:Ubiquitin carboxyl-terminal hydrolase 42 [Elasticomyces elasticus]
MVELRSGTDTTKAPGAPTLRSGRTRAPDRPAPLSKKTVEHDNSKKRKASVRKPAPSKKPKPPVKPKPSVKSKPSEKPLPPQEPSTTDGPTPLAKPSSSGRSSAAKKPALGPKSPYRVNKNWKVTQNSRSKGLNNPGNLCYRRSPLQALLHLPELVNWLDAQSATLDADNHIVASLDALAKAYWDKPSMKAQRLSALDRLIHRIGPPNGWPHINPRIQADAHEFMQWLVEMLGKEKGDARSDSQIDTIFRIHHEKVWVCKHCSHPHVSRSEEFGLLLGIQQPKRGLDMNEYLNVYHNETLSQIKCDNCNKTCCPAPEQSKNAKGPRKQWDCKCDTGRTSTITQAPEVLIIQLGRFQVGLGSGTSKVKTNVPFDLNLDLTRFLPRSEGEQKKSKGKQKKRKGKQKKSKGEQKKLTYRLSSVVKHSGTLHSGHYTATVRERDGDDFYRISDAAVNTKPATEKEITSNTGEFTPYILTFVKVE